ncbi:uncharacterized protein LOC142981219 isoform X1 [Anticarsia gemmatalis]|uniref:uncharacterized protein LOC142981219 isoform X1 n=1 Tax=Anticarsia gemmatalis TaxID=129554 RepID=UPI003F76E8DB
MEQMYLIEIFIDKVTVFTSEGDESTANKNLIIKIKFGPKIQFIIKEGQLAANDEKRDDTIEITESGRRQWSRTIRVGKSYLFPSYPDTVLTILNKFPLEIEVWNDDENETDNQMYVGIGSMIWHTKFYHYLKDTADICKMHEPLTLKEITTLYQECCCRQAGEVNFILRVSALGDSIITEFQQLMKNPDSFAFRTNKAPSMFECKRIEGDDPNFCMVGSLYETTTLEDPDVVDNAQKKIEICTELQSCGVAGAGKAPCEHEGEGTESGKKVYAINKIKMGEITGPCGNFNCPLAHKVRTYIRNLDTYKSKAGATSGTKGEGTKKICGSCSCKDDRWHREDCPETAEKGKDGGTGQPEQTTCSGCGGFAKPGDTCMDRKNQHYGTGATPRSSKTQIQYVTKVPDYKDAIFRRDFVIEDCYSTAFDSQDKISGANHKTRSVSPATRCSCSKAHAASSYTKPAVSKPSVRTMGTNNPWVYNYNEAPKNYKTQQVYNVCTDMTDEKDCKCNPPKPSPPCKTFDCNCIAEMSNIASRKAHRPFCPLYKHKNSCPVNVKRTNEEEENKREDDEDEAEPLPYGLPPIQLGPCPVMGRPCSVPDGFARMYKTAALPANPPSYSDAGKVCCSREYERIKKALKEYMKHQKDHDLRCVNKFNVDTERRCCDKEQVLLSLMGKECCGAHKMAIQEKFKEDNK